MAVASSPWLFLVPSGGISGCSDATRSCSSVALSALRVSVVGDSDERVCDVTLHIQGPGLDEMRTLSSDSCNYAGGNEPGRYLVSVARNDAELTKEEVTVSGNDCGPVTKDLIIQVPPS